MKEALRGQGSARHMVCGCKRTSWSAIYWRAGPSQACTR